MFELTLIVFTLSPPCHVIFSAGLEPSDDPLGYVASIDQHIEDVTGLGIDTAEMLEVANYGVGGHFQPHYDFTVSVRH